MVTASLRGPLSEWTKDAHCLNSHRRLQTTITTKSLFKPHADEPPEPALIWSCPRRRRPLDLAEEFPLCGSPNPPVAKHDHKRQTGGYHDAEHDWCSNPEAHLVEEGWPKSKIKARNTRGGRLTRQLPRGDYRGINHQRWAHNDASPPTATRRLIVWCQTTSGPPG